LRRTVSRLSGDIAGLTSQMTQLMGLVQVQQAQLTELAGRPPTVIQQPVFANQDIPRTPSPSRTVYGSPPNRQPFDSPPAGNGFPDMATGNFQQQDSSSSFGPTPNGNQTSMPNGQDPGVQASSATQGANPPSAMIVLPDGTQIPLGPASPSTSPTGAAAAGSTGVFGQNTQLDAFQKSDKWLPEMPKLDGSKWRTRIDEILGFESFIDRLMSWVGLASDTFATEIKGAIERTVPIENSIPICLLNKHLEVFDF